MNGGSMTDHFPDLHEFKRFTRNFITNRINSLKKDVEHCLSEPFAPFPAILYCLSTIDLLGALNAGQADKRTAKNTKTNSKNYMIEFMNYTEEQATLIIELFRHKLVHLAQPHAVHLNNKTGKRIGWIYHHANPEKHLLVEDLPPGMELIIKTGWRVKVDQYFNIGIYDLMSDIVNSVQGHGGFLDKFETDSVVIQPHVKKALEQIYDPES
jgi:hypothetical protein